ncbi:Putative Cyclin-related protein [Gryllus bimaculatus]|nr:Putative Cyclin-related protein [Gryllus bimaculatus]
MKESDRAYDLSSPNGANSSVLVERSVRVERLERVECAERVARSEREERSERLERAERIELAEPVERAERVECAERAERSEQYYLEMGLGSFAESPFTGWYIIRHHPSLCRPREAGDAAKPLPPLKNFSL